MSLEELPGPHLTRSQLGGLDLVTHLLDTAARHPQPVVTHAVESFFAPHMDTVGCVGVRGPDAIREVLTNAADFAPLQPALDNLPPDVRRLSAGMFTMDGELHARFRSELRGLFSLDEPAIRQMTEAVEAAVASWIGAHLDLYEACRLLSRDVWGAVMFGPGDPGRTIGTAVQEVVDSRRARRFAATPADRRETRRQAIAASRGLDALLRDWLASGDREGLLEPLGREVADDHAADMAVAHATAVFAASSEPAAASLAWAVLALTQRGDIEDEIRAMLAGSDGREPATVSAGKRSGDALERLILETQRLLPSSAIVTRATLRPVEVAGQLLPERCEVMVSSLVAQRDRERFPEPTRLDPDRWNDLEVGPFEFFPFGAGVRRCLGAGSARTMLRITLAALVAEATVGLAFDSRLGWQMPDALTPSRGIPIVVAPAATRLHRGRAEGKLTEIVDFGLN